MCTLVVIHEPRTPLPVVVASNRDERTGRKALPVGRHWPGEPFRAGKDVLAGGTWAGVHDAGFGVFVLNGPDALGPAPGKRSRGQLVLDLLRTGSADAAEAAMGALDPTEYRPFHLVVASASGVMSASVTEERVDVRRAGTGVTMLTAHGADTDASERQRAHRARFETVAATWRATGEVSRLRRELTEAMAAPAPPGSPWHAAMCLHGEGFGTRSSFVVTFSPGGVSVHAADGPPDTTPYLEVEA